VTGRCPIDPDCDRHVFPAPPPEARLREFVELVARLDEPGVPPFGDRGITSHDLAAAAREVLG